MKEVKKVNAFTELRKEAKMSKIMDLLLERKWSNVRIAAFMNLIARQRTHTTMYSVSHVNSHIKFRENQVKAKAKPVVKETSPV